MRTGLYHFDVGAFEGVAVSDGTLTYTPPRFPPPATLLFCHAPPDSLEQALRQNDIQPEYWTEWTSPYICVLVETGEYRILIDTGADGFDPNTGKLLQNLQAEGITPESIDVVILTHCHPDHIGGITLDGGKPAFPNARHAMWKDEWDFWTSERAEEELDEHLRGVLLKVARQNLPPIRDRLDLIEREREIVPGVHAIAAPGHTPGHMVIAISSEGEQLLCISDVVLHPIHLEHPEWCAVVDFAPDQVVPTRRRILNRAAAERALVLAFHFPFPGLGHVVPKGDGWEWQPIAAAV
jgi:glyoxylase-like metal-dependent hydrolase (beta-lactamase superfamily II)